MTCFKKSPHRIRRPAFCIRPRISIPASPWIGGGRRGSKAANVNDGFTGKAPDLGAYEVGQPIPHYGRGINYFAYTFGVISRAYPDRCPPPVSRPAETRDCCGGPGLSICPRIVDRDLYFIVKGSTRVIFQSVQALGVWMPASSNQV